jgi:cell division protein FtsB
MSNTASPDNRAESAPAGDVSLNATPAPAPDVPAPADSAGRPPADPLSLRVRRALTASLKGSARVAAASACAVLIGLLIRSSIRAHEKNAALWARAQAVSAECLRLEERRSALAREAYALENDPFYVEKRIRQDWRQLREGEILLDRPRGR